MLGSDGNFAVVADVGFGCWLQTKGRQGQAGTGHKTARFSSMAMGKEEGVVVHKEGQGQAVGLKGARQEVEVTQESFGGIEAGSDIVTGIPGRACWPEPTGRHWRGRF